MNDSVVPEYGFQSSAPAHTARYLWPAIEQLLPPLSPSVRVLDIGCGNGANARRLMDKGVAVIGFDASSEGIEQARRAYPGGRFERLAIHPQVLQSLGEAPFDIVISTEVVEHLYSPREWARCAFNALTPGGRLICSTPYHGYLKNLAISISGKWDWHLKPLWDGGHIKFWSRRTLTQLLHEAGFVNVQFRGAGRAPYLWMSMVMSGDRPV